MALADILAREGWVQDAEAIAAALLHDTVEDTDASLKEIEARFGGRVVSGIAAIVRKTNSMH